MRKAPRAEAAFLPPALAEVRMAKSGLDASERRFHRALALAAGKHSLREIAEQAGLSVSRVHQLVGTRKEKAE